MKIVAAVPAFFVSLFLTTSFTVNDAQGIEFDSPNWVIPVDQRPYPPISVSVGDSLTFKWDSGTHDVWVYPSGECANEVGKYQIASTADSPTTYTFTAEDASKGEITFVCDIGTHCELGMIMDVIVLGGSIDATEEPTGLFVTAEPTPFVTEEPTPFVTEERTLMVIIPPEFTADPPIVDETFPPDSNEAVEQTDPPTATAAPQFDTCYVCGVEENSMTNLDEIVQLPGGVGSPPNTFFPVSCSDLYTDGLNGDIPEASCPRISQLAFVPCGCVPPNFTCNICGGDDDNDGIELTIKAPDNTVNLPTVATPVVCSDLADAGFNGELTPAECNAASLFAFTPCGCAPANFTCSVCGFDEFTVQLPDVQITSVLGSAASPITCGELESQGASGQLSPQECSAAEAIIRTSGSCGCGINPDDIELPLCNICEGSGGVGGSNDTEPFTPDVTLLLSATDGASTCGELYELGQDSQLGLARCRAAQNQATTNCNCAPKDYTCKVCDIDPISGEGQEMLTPDANFSDPNGLLVNCGILESAGLDGIITPTDCGIISRLAQLPCGCSPVGFTCNICGTNDDAEIDESDRDLFSVSDPDATFVPGDAITCGEAETQGLAGVFTPTVCNIYSSLAQLPGTCGCTTTAGGDGDGTTTTGAPSASVSGSVTTAAPVVASAVTSETIAPVVGTATPVMTGAPVVVPAATVTTTDVPVVAPVEEEGEETTATTTTNGGEESTVVDDVPATTPPPEDTTTTSMAPIATSTAITFDPEPASSEAPVATPIDGTVSAVEGSAESASSSSSGQNQAVISTIKRVIGSTTLVVVVLATTSLF